MTLEAVQFHKKRDGGWRVQNVGFAQKNDKGGIDLILTSLPLPTGEGMAKVVIQQRQERGATPEAAAPPDPAQQGPQSHAPSDEIPFAPQFD